MGQRFEETEATISLHGLGFLQVKLGGNQRLHVWHPGLPRRRCHVHSQIHDHRFDFSSTILVGTQVNWVYADFVPTDRSATHVVYIHDGERLPTGNRPWTPRGKLCVNRGSAERVEAGETYYMLRGVFHSTVPGGDGRVATIMRKTFIGTEAARSLCEVGVEPHADFDRLQMEDDDMWATVRDVLG